MERGKHEPFFGGSILAGIMFITGVSGASASNAYVHGLRILEGTIPLRGSTLLYVADDVYRVKPLSDRKWFGYQSERASNLSRAAEAFTQKNPEIFAGTAFTEDSNHLEIYVKQQNQAKMKELDNKLSAVAKPGEVIIVPVEYSSHDLEEAKRAILAEYGDRFSVGEDVTRNLVVIEPNYDFRDVDMEPGSVYKLAKIVSGVKLEQDYSGINVAVSSYRKYNSASGRNNDTSPYTMGGKIHGESGENCSLGVPIYFNGNTMALTAGHCTSSMYNN